MNACLIRKTRNLDRFDPAILRILQKDNRTPQRTIAAQVNLSPAAVQRRIAALEASGVIVANVVVLAPDALQPAITVVGEVHLLNDQSSIVEPTKTLFLTTPEIQQCYYVTGSAGFILVMIIPDMTSYEAISRRFFADNPVVVTFRTLVVLDTVKAEPEIVVPEGK